MPTIEANRSCWSGYDWASRGEEWSRMWGSAAMQWYGTVLPRIFRYLEPAHTVLEIAPGAGRFTQFLHRWCKRLVLIDLTERCIELCRERFAELDHLEYHVNDGRSLAMVPDDSIDLVISLDSLVHAEADAIDAYLEQLPAKLRRPDGVAVLHHSNLGAFADPATGELTLDNRHWRATSVSAEGVARVAATSGLRCIAQELLPWGAEPLIDCLSVLTLPGSRFDRERQVLESPGFLAEAERLSQLGRLYSSGEAAPSTASTPIADT